MAEANFSHCLFNLLVFYTNARFNLRKTNAANEGLVGRLSLGRLVLYAGSQTDCRSHSNSLSNKTDNILTGYQDYYPSVIVVVRWPKAGQHLTKRHGSSFWVKKGTAFLSLPSGEEETMIRLWRSLRHRFHCRLCEAVSSCNE